MFEEDDTPRPVPQRLARLVLDTLSIEDLQAYIGELQGEITRAQAAIAAKTAARGSAESFFRKPQ